MNDRRLKRRGLKNGQAVWTAVLPLARGADGNRRQHRFTFSGTKKAAENALIQELSRIGSGSFVAPERTTLGHYIVDFLANSKGSFSQKTWERYEQMARTHLIPKLGNVELQKLKTGHLNKVYSAWLDSGLSRQTVLHHHRFLHRMLAQALREDRVFQNVAANASKPKVSRREMRAFSGNEISSLMSVASGTPLAPLVMIALASGARRGELLGAKWSDVDFTRGSFSIRRSLEQTKGGVSEKTPKSGKSRMVQLPCSAMDTLRRHRVSQKRLGPGYIFPGDEEGNAWTPQRVTDAFRAVARKAGIEGASFHSLRHTCASQLLSHGVHPKVVQEMLGHSTIAITMDLYSHVTPSLQIEAAAKMDIVLRSALEGAQPMSA